MPKKRALIIDAHHGCAACHQKLLEQLGYEVEIIYLGNFQVSDRDGLLYEKDPAFRSKLQVCVKAITYFIKGVLARSAEKRQFMRKKYFIKTLKHLCVYHADPKVGSRLRDGQLVLIEKNYRFIRFFVSLWFFRSWLARFDVLICSFPPVLFQVLLPIAKLHGQVIIVNMGHRFNINIPPHAPSFARVQKMLTALMKDKKHIVGAMTEYDRHYAEHYLKMPVTKTGIKMFQIALSKKNAPQKDVILIAPVHRHYSMHALPFKNSDELNELHRQFCKARGIKSTLTFKTIREACGEFYEMEELHLFAGVVMFPYSSFSISGLELYECNIPYFYPSVDFLLAHDDMLDDYRLYPQYILQEDYGRIFADMDDPHSPNSRDVRARQKWLKYFGGYEMKNALLFSDLDELFAQVHSSQARFAEISSAMYEENKRERDEVLMRWRALLDERRQLSKRS